MSEKYWKDWKVVDRVRTNPDDEPTRAEIEMTEYWGERCPEFNGYCIACHAWKLFDATGEIAR